MGLQIRPVSQWVPRAILWLFPQCQIAKLELTHLAESPYWFSGLLREGYYGRNGQVGAMRTASTKENSKLNQKQNTHIPGGIVEIQCHLKEWKDAGVVMPTMSSFNSPVWPVQKPDGSWRMTMDYISLTKWGLQLQLLYQMWFHCLTKISLYAVIDLASAFFLTPVSQDYQSTLLSADKASNTPSLSYLRDLLILQPNFRIQFEGSWPLFPSMIHYNGPSHGFCYCKFVL